MDDFEPRIDDRLTAKEGPGLILWMANLFARTKYEFYVRRRYLRSIVGTFSTTSISGTRTLDTFTIPANNFITPSTDLLLELFGVTASTVATKSLTVKADGVTLGQITGLGSTANAFNLSVRIVAITQNGQTTFATAIVNGANVVVANVDTNIDFTKDITFSVIATTSVSTPAEITLKHLALTYSGKLPNGGAA